MARREGHSFGGFLILGLVLNTLSFVLVVQLQSWVPGVVMLPLPLLIAHLVDDRQDVDRSPNS